MATRSRTLSFRSLLTLTLLLILGGSVAVLVCLSTYFGSRNFRMLTATIAEQTLGRVEAEVRLLLQKAQDLNRQGVQLLANRPLHATNFNALALFLGSSLEAQPQLARMTLMLEPHGEFVQAERLRDGRIRIQRAVQVASNQFELILRDWPETRTIRPRVTRIPAASLPSASGIAAIPSPPGPFWGASHEWEEPGQPTRWVVRYSSPVLDARGRRIGLFSVSLALEELNRFLAGIDGEIPGYVAVFERGNGRHPPRLIGHPRPEMAGKNVSGAPGQRALDPVMFSYLQQLRLDPRFEGPNRPHDDIARPFLVGNVSYLGSFNDLERSNDPPWVIAMVLPVSEVAVGVEKNLRWAVSAAAVFLALGAGASLWIARRIAQPMLNLGTDARAWSRLDFSATARPLSRIREVRQLEQALDEARTSLRSFRKYVPADVVRTLMESGTEARLGGHSAHLTLLFSDIVDFTHTAESTDPQLLVEQLGEYLAAVSGVIHEHHGIVDKYIGDGVMAFWGAPRPDPEQAVRAARAALDIQHRLDAMNAAWRSAGRPAFQTRIGLNSGEVVVGNIGSEDRLNYTAIGDPVNLASRLESLNRLYGTRILISDATRMAAGDVLLTRPVARVAVKGSGRGIVVYELIGVTATADAPAHRRVALSESAFDAFDAGQTQEAATLYAAVLAEFPGDGVATAQLQLLAESAPEMSGHTGWIRHLDRK